MKPLRTSELPLGIRMLLRVALGLLVMVLAHRVAQLSWGDSAAGEPDAASSDEASDYEASGGVPSASADQAGSSKRLREGTTFTNEVGTFKATGDRVYFHARESDLKLAGLENLNLARIVNMVRDEPESEWSVSGLVTEYQGLNYLLITKAIRKSRDAGRRPPLVPRPAGTPDGSAGRGGIESSP